MPHRISGEAFILLLQIHSEALIRKACAGFRSKMGDLIDSLFFRIPVDGPYLLVGTL